MAELKTKKTDASVAQFIQSVADKDKRADSEKILKMMRELTGEEAKMWGSSIIGFGAYNYKYPTGRTGQWFVTGFSPRKQALTLYIMSGFDKEKELMQQLGKYKTGKACLYINHLSDIDEKVLKELIKCSIKHVKTVEREMASGKK